MTEPNPPHPPAPTGESPPCVILIPVHDDGPALRLVLEKLDAALAAAARQADILIVDDASLAPPQSALAGLAPTALSHIQVLTLRRNLSHQRAIAIGLAHLEKTSDHPFTIVMDGDGEDDPADVPRLLDRAEGDPAEPIVFAERTRRSESLAFRVSYWLYRQAHRTLTGQQVRFGNFSVIPRKRLESLAVVSELWNHYAAAVLKSKQPYVALPTHRAPRLQGRSRMNTVGLVTHGLSAISVYAEIVGVRLLLASLALVVVVLIGLLGAVFIRLGTSLAIPGWATTAFGILLVLLTQGLLLAIVFSFVVLGGRQGSSFLPTRDYSLYIRDIQTLYPPEPSP